MDDKVRGIKSEYRELTPNEIGDFVRRYRQIHQIKRATLAEQAGISEKSLERLEGGVRMSEELYRKVAVQTGQREEAFLGPRYILTPEEALQSAAKTLQEWNEKYLTLEVRAFTDERDMRRVLECRDLLLFDDSQIKTDVLDLTASFKQNLTDWGDIYSDIPEPGRLDAQRSLIEELREIERHGYVARYGCYQTDVVAGSKSIKMSIAMVTFFLRTDWQRVALKTMAVPRRIAAEDITL